MPDCPVCHTDVKRRQDGKCPSCAVPLVSVDGEWIDASETSPGVILLRYFETLVSRQQSATAGVPVTWHIPPRGATYRMELALAGRLVKETGDLQLAVAALGLLFTRKQFCWKTYTSLLQLKRDFSLALAIASAQRDAEDTERRLQQEALESLRSREDLFNSQ